MIAPKHHHPIQLPRIFQAFLFTCLALSVNTAIADAVRLGGFWIENVIVQEIAGGKILYTNPNGYEVSPPFSSLEGLKIKAFPQLGQAEDAVIAGTDNADTLMILLELRKEVNKPWLKHWIDFRIVAVADRAGKPIQSIEAFLRLVKDDADNHYLTAVPDHSLSAINSRTTKQQALRLIDDVLPILQTDAAIPIQELRNRIDPSSDSTQINNGQPTDATSGQPTIKTIPYSGKSAVVLPNFIIENDPANQMLRAGQFEQAIKTAEKAANAESNMLHMRLYQLGVAQLNLGLAKNDPNLIKSAGLNLMRVAIHYPTSTYAGPSLLEAGLVHQKIGRLDLARQLYDRAAGLIDPDDQPLEARRVKLIQSLNSASKPVK